MTVVPAVLGLGGGDDEDYHHQYYGGDGDNEYCNNGNDGLKMSPT